MSTSKLASGSAGKPPHTNRLAKETSPYLLQHAHNPVDWYPWGPEAFAKARAEQKPIFLSVGYSACHWCHVMEHECFEDEEVAKVLNEGFVSIKVDREERPDVDDIYMHYVQMVTQRGGWPMSVVMTPEGLPFFGGTYFPKQQFMPIMDRIREGWATERERLNTFAEKAKEALKSYAEQDLPAADRPLDRGTVERFVPFQVERFDFEEGGNAGAPKFPPHSALALLLEIVAGGKAEKPAREMLALTLDKMQLGGIHDHVGGGFHRYSTDGFWLLPHFEKMLYDNAQLAAVYARASVVLQDPAYARTSRGIYDWVLREMTSKDGAFYSAYDADSDGEEGKFYVWDRNEVDKILGDDADLFCELYQIRPEGNFHDEATHQPSGMNIPHLAQSLDAHAKRLDRDPDELRAWAAGCLEKLRAVRAKRVWPGLDDKVLTSWNALMIGSLAQGGLALKEPAYTKAAVRAADWLLRNLRGKDGRWRATYNRGQARLAAYQDDHAFLAEAFLDLHEATGEKRWVDETERVVAEMDRHFWDAAKGGYFFTADDHEELLIRMKKPADNATPSGNGIAAQALVRLARATGKKAYAERAVEVMKAYHIFMDKAPAMVESMLVALDEFLEDGHAIASIVAAPAAKVTRGPVTAELLLGAGSLLAGGRVPVAVRLEFEPQWHVQAHEPSQKGLVGTAVRLESAALGALKDFRYPAAEELTAPELGGALAVYKSPVLVGAWLEVPEDLAPGTARLQVEVTFQACDERSCARPEQVLLTLTVTVSEKGTPAKPLHEEVFRSLGMKL
ncbi:MAG: thioredoxin domain-containing protein [Planctomycetes bacterium]|nr:thioredoxin domain-containing protein [Planctomycetota bacterium]